MKDESDKHDTLRDIKESKGKKNQSKEKKENLRDLLKRVSATPQALQNLVASSLPYLLISPKENALENSTGVGFGKKTTANKVGVNVDVKKRSKLPIRPITNRKNTKTSVGVLGRASNRQFETSNNSKLIKYLSGKAKINLVRDNSPNEGNVLNKKKSAALSLPTHKDAVDDIDKSTSNETKKEVNTLRNSTLFSITEKSFLSLNNYSPVAVDTLLLQKLIVIDQESARKLIHLVLSDGADEAIKEQVDKENDEAKLKTNKKYKMKVVKKNLANQIYNLLLSRITANKERPAEILFNVVLQLCKKNQFTTHRRVRKLSSLFPNSQIDEKKLFIDSLNIPRDNLKFT